MGVTLRAATLIVATAIVTLSNAANADNRYDAARVRRTHSLVFGAFGGLWFALLLPLRPFSLLLQRRLSPLLQRPLSLLLQMSTTTAPKRRLGLARPSSV